MQDTKKTIIKLLVITILVLGVYRGSGLTPVEEKRAEATLRNFNQAEAVSFNLEAELASSRDGFYELIIQQGYKEENRGSGSFELETVFDGDDTYLEGEYRYFDSDLYLRLEEGESDQVVGNVFGTDQAVGNWIKTDTYFTFPDMKLVEESVEVISEDEEIDGKEMYQYELSVSVEQFTDNILSMEMMTGKEDLNLYGLGIEDQLDLVVDAGLGAGLPLFSTGSSPTVNISADFFDYNQEKDIGEPIEYLEI